MRWAIAVLFFLAAGPLYVPSTLPPSHETRVPCRKPLYAVTAGERSDYLQCLGHFIDEQQRAIGEHNHAIADAAFQLQMFALDSR